MLIMNGGGLGLERSVKIYGASSENDSIQIEPVTVELYMYMMRQTLICVRLIPYGMQHGQLNAF